LIPVALDERRGGEELGSGKFGDWLKVFKLLLEGYLGVGFFHEFQG